MIIMKTAIVLGATGLVGRSVVEKLCVNKQIEKVIAITRRSVEYQSSKVVNQVVDFNDLNKYSSIFNADLLFSCLGTTIKQAGSVAAQREVDLNYQLRVAQIAAQNKVSHYLLVSSGGANPKSNNAYFKMKGELENAVKALNFKGISIFQPSLLLGIRDHVRIGEFIVARIMSILKLLPGLKRYRPIKAEQVAEKMIQVSLSEGKALQQFTLEDVFPEE